jgi:nucleotide-binding universal stress UspA family protein
MTTNGDTGHADEFAYPPMEMPENPQVLVPLDGSQWAESIIPEAAALAHATGSGLILLRIVPRLEVPDSPVWSTSLAPVPWEVWEIALNQARVYLADLASQVTAVGQRLDAKPLVVQTRVLEGDPALTILSVAANNPDIFAIAIATHGESGVGRWSLGSVAQKVLQVCHKPLMVVHPRKVDALHGGGEPAYHTVIVPLDGSPLAEQALEPAKRLATATHATLVLLSVIPPATDVPGEAAALQREPELALGYLGKIASRLESEGLRVRVYLSHGYPPEAIIQAGEREKESLIVMATHGRGGFQRLWLGSVTMRVVQGTRLPVLVVRAKEGVEARGKWAAAGSGAEG